MWEIEYTDEFFVWWESLTVEEQASVNYSVGLLEGRGPQLDRPHVDSVKNSRYSNKKELRTQHQGRPIRTFFAFDPRRAAILLIGGDKTGDEQFYQRMIPVADRLYEEYLHELQDEGLI